MICNDKQEYIEGWFSLRGQVNLMHQAHDSLTGEEWLVKIRKRQSRSWLRGLGEDIR